MALLRKEICNPRHRTGLRHPVRRYLSLCQLDSMENWSQEESRSTITRFFELPIYSGHEPFCLKGQNRYTGNGCGDPEKSNQCPHERMRDKECGWERFLWDSRSRPLEVLVGGEIHIFFGEDNESSHLWAHCHLRSSWIIFNTLQHIATYCNTLQHTATRCN